VFAYKTVFIILRASGFDEDEMRTRGIVYKHKSLTKWGPLLMQ